MESFFNSAINDGLFKKALPIFGGGEMGDRIRDFDWAKTGLGPILSWPNSLHSTVNLMLQSTVPLVILWGKEGITIYNNAYAVVAGKRHPDLLGNSYLKVFPARADFMKKVIDQALQGKTLSYKEIPYTVYRNDEAEDIWWDLDCSPVLDASAKPFATFIVNTETYHYGENNQRLQSKPAGSAVGFYEFNVNTGISSWGERLWKILGYLLEEIRQELKFEFLLSLIHPADRARVEAAINRTISEGCPYEEEYRIQHKKGHYIYLHSKGKLISDEHGQPIWIVGVVDDITERKKIEEALKASEERFRIMAEASGILVAQTDESGKAVYFNQEWLNLTGRSMQELLDDGWGEFLHPADREDFILAYKNAFAKREVLKKEFRLLSKKGEYRWQLAIVSPFFSPDGTFTGYVSSCVDVSDLRWTKERLAYQNQLTNLITDNATVGLFMMDAEGKTTFMNPAAEKISGFTFEEARGKVLHDLTHHLHPDGSPFPMKDCTIGKTVFSLGHLKNHEDIFIHKDGSFYPVLCSASAIWDNEALKGLILEVQDITEQKKTEKALEVKNAQLVRINNDLDNFVYTASHDLKAPIHNIEGLVKVLEKNLDPESLDVPIIKSVMGMIYKSIDKFNVAIKDLAEVAKVGNINQEEVSEIFFREVLEEVMLNCKSQIEEVEASISIDFSEAPSIHFARKHLRSIVYNLLSNAIKYRSPQRALEIRISTVNYDREFVLFTVQDNGLGIKESDKPKVFIMFKRLHQHVEGTGVGMTIVKRIIDNHGGKIELESEFGKGSAFKVYLKKS